MPLCKGELKLGMPCTSPPKKIPSKDTLVDLWVAHPLTQPKKSEQLSRIFAAWIFAPRLQVSFPFCQRKSLLKKNTKSNPTIRQKGCLTWNLFCQKVCKLSVQKCETKLLSTQELVLKPLLSKGLQEVLGLFYLWCMQPLLSKGCSTLNSVIFLDDFFASRTPKTMWLLQTYMLY